MRILAFDTSSNWCSVALGDGAAWLVREEDVGQRHSERVVPMVRALLDEAGWRMDDLHGIAFGAGPGSFTGIRIACGVAQGLALGLDVPVAPVPTLAALAHESRREHAAKSVVSCIDARMGEVYVAAYTWSGSEWREELAPDVLRPHDVHLPRQLHSPAGAGNGFAAYPELASLLSVTHVVPDARPTARSIGQLGMARIGAGEGRDAADALPVYVRHRVALTTAERAAGVRL